MPVSIAKCENYDYENVYAAVKNVVDLCGGIDRFVKKGTKVFVKPNLLMPKKVETATTTHFNVVKAICSLVIDAGGEITLGDSCGGLYNKAVLEVLYKTTGMAKVAEELGFSLNYDVASKEVDVSVNGNLRKISLIKPYFDADIVINVCKLKTHVMSNYTGAVKNLYGLVPGLTKAEYHYKYPDKEKFFSLVTDLCMFVKPELNIMDAVTMMEGDGPSNGTPRHMGLVLASENPFNLDRVGQELIGFKPEEIWTSVDGRKYGVMAEIEEIEVRGENYGEYMISDVKKPNVKSSTFDNHIPPFLNKLIKKYMAPYPKFNKDRCIACGNCATACPAKVLKVKDKVPYISDKKKCIKCYCCHELCPQNAVKLRRH